MKGFVCLGSVTFGHILGTLPLPLDSPLSEKKIMLNAVVHVAIFVVGRVLEASVCIYI